MRISILVYILAFSKDDLTLDEKVSKKEEMPIFNLRVLIDPEKYHWSGYEYSSKYAHTIDYIEDYLNQTLKYMGLSTDNFNSIDTRFDSKKIKMPEVSNIDFYVEEISRGTNEDFGLEQVLYGIMFSDIFDSFQEPTFALFYREEEERVFFNKYVFIL